MSPCPERGPEKRCHPRAGAGAEEYLGFPPPRWELGLALMEGVTLSMSPCPPKPSEQQPDPSPPPGRRALPAGTQGVKHPHLPHT